MRAGFQPLAADLFADVDLCRIATTTRISPYPDGLIDWLRSIEPSAWMYTGALENHPELVDQMAWIAPLLGNPGEVLARVRSPWELSKALNMAGLLFPEMCTTSASLPIDGSWLAKTYRGASGSGVRSWYGGQGAPNRENEVTGAVCFQKRIEGTPCAAVFVAQEGSARLLGVTKQLIGVPWLRSHEFQFAGSIGPWPMSAATQETLERLGNVLAEQFELAGLFGVDFILDRQQQVWTIEVNPRYTASVEVVERFTGMRAIAEHVAACGEVTREDKRFVSPVAPVGGYKQASTCLAHGKAILFVSRDVVITPAFAEYSRNESLQAPWPTLGDISPVGLMIESGRPVLTVFASGANVETVEQHLCGRIAEIEAKLYTR